MSDAAAPPPTPVSRGAAWKIVLSVVVVTGVVGYVLRTSVVSAEYYKHVDEVMASPGQFHGKKLQVHGNVVPGSIEQAKGTLMYRFKIETGAMSRPDPRPVAVIAASYTGLVPDTFKDGAEVVAKGTLGADDKLEVVPDGIMAKCPSKYDSNAKASVQDPGVAAK
ncbi:MAG TPA: cytochrome c maturation protein CcmE [Polyangia bacterium]|nr:cytochrome c maturation protein CcmE [Polyangia bacterium]